MSATHVQGFTAPAAGAIDPVGPAQASAIPHHGARRWSYEEAFKRNRGLITEEEQQKLRHSRVAIAGMGGVGGVHLVTLVRLGVGGFTVADPDVFEVANFNRQYGATISNLGRNKAHAMAEAARDMNPELQLRVMSAAVDEHNIDDFLDGADLFVDGLDFFAIEAHRVAFRRAAARGIWAITAGPIGFSTAWLIFDPVGMAFDDYFDLHDGMERIDQLVAFAVGLTPRATHLGYMDLSTASIGNRTGPSASPACQLSSGALAVEAIKILTQRGGVSPAPAYRQFDPYRGRWRHGRLTNGNRGWIQRIKRRLLTQRLFSQEFAAV